MVESDRTFYTVTMARMLAEQGNLAKAAEICRYLLRREPDREDLAEDLATIEADLRSKDPYDLVGVLSRWAELMLAQGRLGRLAVVRRGLRRRR